MAKKRKRKGAAPEESVGKQRRREQREDRTTRAQSTPVSSEPALAPAFWFGFEVTWAKLALARVVVFALLAIDALVQISHAPRFGAGDFNVAQIPLLDSLAPGRALYLVGQLVNAYLFVLVACGVATRYAVPAATAIYGWLYFTSQLDSYQHHYLVWLVLLISCFVPWEHPAGAQPATRVRAWAVRLILVQLALLYLWAAISKLSTAWFDGSTLSRQLHGSLRGIVDATVGIKVASAMVVLTELTLAATVLSPRTWKIAAPLGIALHLTIGLASLDIGLFAWLMIGLYIFVVPDRIWVWLAEHPPITALRRVADALRGAGGSWLVWIIAVAAGVVLAIASRFHHGMLVGLALAVVLVAATIALRKKLAIAWLATAHLLAFTTWTIVDRTTVQASDYFRLWGGSSRRLGDLKTAEWAYRQSIEVAPAEGNGYYQLGRLLLQRNADEEGLAALRRAQDLEPLRARAYVAEARWLAAHGKRAEALAKAREATIVEPRDQEAAALLNTLQKP